jgi:TolB-like protein/Tfp pilus assembly protein PilF
VGDLLGAGGMGEVYRARDPRLGREVAIKVLPGQVGRDATRLRRFEQEARAASALNHPNILTVFDVGVIEGTSYLVTELLEGSSLRARLQRAKGSSRGGAPSGADLPLRTAVEWATEIARGLAAAHERGIVHRDLKPENVFITREGRVKILDFGLAKHTGEPTLREGAVDASTEVALTTAGTILGTVGYMSPEQVRGEAAGARSDVFSFGCVLHELVTGERAFPGASAPEVMSAILRDEPAALAGVSGVAVPEALAGVLARCLAKEPARRYGSASELVAALDAAAAAGLPSRIAGPPAAALGPPVTRAWKGALLALGGLALVGLTLWIVRQRSPAGPAAPVRFASLAVLPFQIASRNPDELYLADGMTEALITDLARLGAERVLSSTAVMGYREKPKPPLEIARELGVEALVEGSVLRDGDRLTVDVRLVDGGSGTARWTDRFERDLREVLLLQDEVARAVANALGVDAAVAARLAPPAASRPVDPETFELYLRGRFHWNQRTDEALPKALDQFQRAVERSPDYAPGWAGLADTYLTLFDYDLMPAAEATPAARRAATRALELDNRLAAAHTSLAHVSLHDWDGSEAERHFRRAIELDPSYALAYHWYALALTTVGKLDEAVAAMERGRALDPLSLRMNADLGMAYIAARQYDRAIAQEKKTLELDPKFRTAHWLLGLAYELDGNDAEAVASFRRALELSPGNPNYLAALGHAHAVAGRREEARATLAELERPSKDRPVSPFFIALVYAGLGERDAAFAALEGAFTERSGSIRYLKIEPRLDSLRSDPRYADLMRRVGLPP